MIMGETDVPKHHVRQELCTTRPSYRDGRRLTAVKVYTVHQESKYLLVQNVPAVGAKDQLEKLLSSYGTITELHPLDDFPSENFTEVYLVKYERIQSARFAKKKLDDHAFFGGSLHISYAPEYETVQETREKLQDRRKVIAARIRQLDKESEQDTGPQLNTRKANLQNGHHYSLPASQQGLALPPPAPSPSVPPQLQPIILQPPPPSILPPPQHSILPLPPPPSIPPPPPPPPTSVFQPPPAPVPRAEQALHVQNNAGHHQGQDNSVTPPSCELALADHFFTTEGHNDFVLQIPLPPMPGVNFDASHYRTPHFNRRDYGFAWVPSANATFPPGYDARLSQEEDGANHESKEIVSPHKDDAGTVENKQHYPLSVSSALVVHQQSVNKSDQTRSKPSITAGGKAGKKIIIKQYKPKGQPPRFVPRQVKDKTDSKSDTEEKQKQKIKEDELNREIRKEAFRLGEDQGPTLPTDTETKKKLLGQRPLVEPEVEASVLTSVKAIRKRLSKFISETVPKKQKTIEKDQNNTSTAKSTTN